MSDEDEFFDDGIPIRHSFEDEGGFDPATAEFMQRQAETRPN